MKVFELLSEASLPLLFLLKFFYFCQVAVLVNGDTIKSLNGIDFYNASGGSKTDRNVENDDSIDFMKGATHSRSKRFIAFPVGSSFSTAVCMTTGVLGNPTAAYLSMGLNWGFAYDLPNSTWVLQQANGFGFKDQEENVSPQIKRRHRRDLYGKLETLINGMGYNGRDCILRALCESRQYFHKTKMSMIGEMLRVIFSLPKQRIFTRELVENSDIVMYDRAYRRSRSTDDCSDQYDCGFSLLELAFGKYSTPPDGYYTKH